jgi:WD40 repeat protein
VIVGGHGSGPFDVYRRDGVGFVPHWSGSLGRQIAGAALSPDGRWLVTADGNTLRLWNPETGLYLGQAAAVEGARLNGLAFSPDGLTLASGDSGKEPRVRLWRLKDVRPPKPPP